MCNVVIGTAALWSMDLRHCGQWTYNIVVNESTALWSGGIDVSAAQTGSIEVSDLLGPEGPQTRRGGRIHGPYTWVLYVGGGV